MPGFEDATLKFDVPRDWEDRTIVAFAAPPRPSQQSTSNVVMTRDGLPDGDSLESYAARHVAQMTERMSDLEVLSQEPCQVAGRPAVSVRVASQSPQGRFQQRLTMAELPGRVVASFTMTAPEQDAAQMDPLFDRILASVQVKSATAGEGT